MPKKRVSLYVEAEYYDRTRDACAALGSSVSEYLSDYMTENIDMLEIAAKTKDPAQVAEVFRSSFFEVFTRGMGKTAETLRTIQADLESSKEVVTKE